MKKPPKFFAGDLVKVNPNFPEHASQLKNNRENCVYHHGCRWSLEDTFTVMKDSTDRFTTVKKRDGFERNTFSDRWVLAEAGSLDIEDYM